MALTRRAALSAGAALGLAGADRRTPARIVSFNPCLDVILVRLADRRQIAALSHYSRDPDSSNIAALAETFPVTYGTAEEVMALHADLVLIDSFTPPATQQALRKLGVRTAPFGAPETVDQSLAQVLAVGEAIGRPDRSRILAQAMAAAIAAATPPAGARRLSALVFQSNGFASAPGTLMDEMMRRAGFDNAAARYGLVRSGHVPLERLIADPPQVLLAGQAKPGAPTWADRVLTHPALTSIGGRMHRAVLPQRLINCGGPVLIETALVLARARADALAAGI